MNRPRIAVFTRPVDNRSNSGSGQYLIQILTSLLQLDHGFDLTFVHNIEKENPLYRAPGVRELLVPRTPFKASKVLRKEKFDLIHYAPVSLMTPLWGVKGVKTGIIHNSEPLLIPRYFSVPVILQDLIAYPLMTPRLDAVVTVSETSRRFLSRITRVPEEKFRVTYNGFNDRFRRIESLPEREAPFLFHISKYSLRKNPFVLLESFALVRERHPDLELVVAGSGWDNSQVQKKMNKLGISESVRLLGYTPEEDVVTYLNQAEAFVFPSLCEGFGIPNIEAQACGCPVVTTAAFAVPEVVNDGAVIVDDIRSSRAFAGGIEQVLAMSYSERNALIDRGFENIRRFSWDESARKLAALWKELLR